MATFADVTGGLSILSKYVNPEEHCVCAEHDVLMAAPDARNVSEEDTKKLDDLGWFWSNEYDSWAIFV